MKLSSSLNEAVMSELVIFTTSSVIQDDFQYQLSENQKLLRDLHDRISKVENVIQKDDGATDLWIDLMIKWLRGSYCRVFCYT